MKKAGIFEAGCPAGMPGPVSLTLKATRSRFHHVFTLISPRSPVRPGLAHGVGRINQEVDHDRPMAPGKHHRGQDAEIGRHLGHVLQLAAGHSESVGTRRLMSTGSGSLGSGRPNAFIARTIVPPARCPLGLRQRRRDLGLHEVEVGVLATLFDHGSDVVRPRRPPATGPRRSSTRPAGEAPAPRYRSEM